MLILGGLGRLRQDLVPLDLTDDGQRADVRIIRAQTGCAVFLQRVAFPAAVFLLFHDVPPVRFCISMADSTNLIQRFCKQSTKLLHFIRVPTIISSFD